MTSETNDTTDEKHKDVNSSSDDVTGEQGMKIAAYYLAAAVERLHNELRLRPMRVETTISDDDGTSAIARINVKPQDKSRGLDRIGGIGIAIGRRAVPGRRCRIRPVRTSDIRHQ